MQSVLFARIVGTFAVQKVLIYFQSRETVSLIYLRRNEESDPRDDDKEAGWQVVDIQVFQHVAGQPHLKT